MPGPAPVVLTAETIAEARALLDGGMSYRAMLRAVGVGERALVRHGVMPPRRKITDAQRRVIMAMWADKAKARAIADAVGCRISTVYAVRLSWQPPTEAVSAAASGGGNVVAACALPAVIIIQLPEHTQRMRQSFRMRGMPDAQALREAMRICAVGSHAQTMPERNA